jgi:sensor histidine kinase YesM
LLYNAKELTDILTKIAPIEQGAGSVDTPILKKIKAKTFPVKNSLFVMYCLTIYVCLFLVQWMFSSLINGIDFQGYFFSATLYSILGLLFPSNYTKQKLSILMSGLPPFMERNIACSSNFLC